MKNRLEQEPERRRATTCLRSSSKPGSKAQRDDKATGGRTSAGRVTDSRTSATDRKGPGRRRLPLVGAHISTAGGFAPVPDRAVSIGAQAVQIFSSNPRTWRTRTAGPDEMAALVAGLQRHRLPLFLHTIYLINLASPDEALRSHSAEALGHALLTGARAAATGVVTHVGSHRGDGFEAALGRVVEAVRAAEAKAHVLWPPQEERKAMPTLLLETAVGAGSIVGARLEELAALLTALSPGGGTAHNPKSLRASRTVPKTAPAPSPSKGLEIGLCLDTAHMFAAGYPVHEEAGLEAIINELRERNLLDMIRLIHLNDSHGAFASNRDHHANPGEGLIGYEALGRVVRHPALSHIPFVLETPGADGHGPDADNIAVVKAMRAGAPAPLRAPARAAQRPRE